MSISPSFNCKFSRNPGFPQDSVRQRDKASRNFPVNRRLDETQIVPEGATFDLRVSGGDRFEKENFLKASTIHSHSTHGTDRRDRAVAAVTLGPLGYFSGENAMMTTPTTLCLLENLRADACAPSTPPLHARRRDFRRKEPWQGVARGVGSDAFCWCCCVLYVYFFVTNSRDPARIMSLGRSRFR